MERRHPSDAAPHDEGILQADLISTYLFLQYFTKQYGIWLQLVTSPLFTICVCARIH